MKTTHSDYERWLWIELIGFDNTLPDYGVAAFLEHEGFVPHAVSLLLMNPDFFHDHAGMDVERTLPYDCCSYAGHPRNDERERQEWTNLQVRGLVAELQRRGVAVFPAVFDMFITQGWLASHPEVRHVRRDGLLLESVCPWKRLSDGTLYEEFFTSQLLRAMEDYGFDGYHGADGYGHPRIPIYDGDFSDDMVGQFLDAAGGSAGDLAGSCDGSPERIARRADWIWRCRRQEWSEFYTGRIAAFWRKVAGALHGIGKQVFLNSTWTRDPFEAGYRYGVEYRRMIDAGVDGFVVEAAAAASETERLDSSARVLHDFAAMLLLLRAAMPDTKLVYLHGVKDTREQWNVLRHTPTSLEREVYTLSSLYRSDSAGALQRCADGLVVCLADGIRREEWRWLVGIWERAFAPRPRRVLGAAILWSDRALARLREEFPTARWWTPHRLVWQLTSRGAPIQSVVRVEDLDAYEGALLVAHPHLLPAEEREKVLDYARGPLICIGPDLVDLPESEVQFEDCHRPDPLVCTAYGLAGGYDVSIEGAGDAPLPGDPMEIREPSSFLEDLLFRPVSDRFLEACVDVLAEAAGSPRVLRAADCTRICAMEDAAGRLVLLIGNDRHGYAAPVIDVGRPIAAVRVLTPFPPLPVEPDGSRFAVKVPGRGAVIVEVTLAGG